MTTSNKSKILTKEEKALIQGIINGEEAAKERIIIDCYEIMLNTIRESPTHLADECNPNSARQ